MSFVRQWLIRVTCAALLTAIADGLMAKGPVKQIGKLVCALVLLCVVLQPIASSELAGMVQNFGRLEEQTTEEREKLSEQRERLMKASIERRCSAYIVDKAAQLGVVCQVQTECVPGEGDTWIPSAVCITGQIEAEKRQALSQTIEAELGIDAAHQIYSGGGKVKWKLPAWNSGWKELWDRYKYLMLVVLAGVVLLLMPSGEKAVGSESRDDIQIQEMSFDLEQMEKKLAGALSRIQGAGEVTVVLTLKESSRRILALDTQNEADSSQTTTVVLSQGSGIERSVPVQSIYPKFQGALVVCSGAGVPQVKLELLDAVRALTGLSAEKISICKGT